MELEARGIPTVVVATSSFSALAHQVAETYGMPHARVVVVEHPLGGISPDDVLARADAAVESVIGLVTRGS